VAAEHAAAGPLAGPATALAAGLLAAALLISLALVLVGPRLGHAMAELSGAPHRAQWWTRLCCAALTIGTLVAALVGYWWHGTALGLAHQASALALGAALETRSALVALAALVMTGLTWARGMPLTSAGREPDVFWAAVDVLRWTLAALQVSLGAISAVVLVSTANASRERAGARARAA
jgi:hypothetical protein